MNKYQAKVLQWARRVRDFLSEYDVKSDLAELTTLRQELDDTLDQLTADAAAQEAITKQSLVQTTEIRRLRKTLRDTHLKPIVRMSRTMELEINGTEITFALPSEKVNSERLAAASDAMGAALNVVGPQFTARGSASNFVEQLSTATKTLRDAIDQRSAQVARRIGTTAAMLGHETRVIQLVRVIDTLVRPVIQSDPELLATWASVVALPRSSKPAGGVVAISAGSTSPATRLAATSAAGQAAEAAA
ncbi:MAG TPA: hypothetical protein VGH98_11225 [Gemmatimonadaceae bacterium]|jgi:hypothetical protein